MKLIKSNNCVVLQSMRQPSTVSSYSQILWVDGQGMLKHNKWALRGIPSHPGNFQLALLDSHDNSLDNTMAFGHAILPSAASDPAWDPLVPATPSQHQAPGATDNHAGRDDASPW